MKDLNFVPIIYRPDLVSPTVSTFVRDWTGEVPTDEFLVTEIELDAYEGVAFCRRYHIPLDEGANCVIVEARRASHTRFVACLVPVGCRMDLGGYVRKHLGARRVSLAEKERVLADTQMEYGSITVVGLPKEWRILIDSRIVMIPRVVIGSGLVRSKLSVPGRALSQLPNSEVIEGLGIPSV